MQLPGWAKSGELGARYGTSFLEQSRSATSTPTEKKGGLWGLWEVNGRSTGRQVATDIVTGSRDLDSKVDPLFWETKENSNPWGIVLCDKSRNQKKTQARGYAVSIQKQTRIQTRDLTISSNVRAQGMAQGWNFRVKPAACHHLPKHLTLGLL